MLLCRLVVASGLACGLLLGPVYVDAQESKLPSNTIIAAPRLRRIVVNQHALCDTGNAVGLDDYLDKHLPTVLRLRPATTRGRWTR
jgi:hypothetical protein